MTISYQFGHVDAHGASVGARAASLEEGEHFVTQSGRNAHGQNAHTAGSNIASTDSAVGSSWA